MELYYPNKGNLVKPDIEPILVDVDDECFLDGFKTCVGSEDYKVCLKYANKRWSKEKTGNYGGGIIKEPEIPGLLGEMAFAQTFGCGVDLEYKKNGDEYDFCFNKLTVDIKTSRCYPWYEQMLILAVSEKNQEVVLPLKCDFYVAAYIDSKKEGRFANIVMVGFSHKKDIPTDIYPAKRKKDTHKNYQQDYCKLKSMHELKKILEC